MLKTFVVGASTLSAVLVLGLTTTGCPKKEEGGPAPTGSAAEGVNAAPSGSHHHGGHHDGGHPPP
jgi:hypothetical protein